MPAPDLSALRDELLDLIESTADLRNIPLDVDRDAVALVRVRNLAVALRTAADQIAGAASGRLEAGSIMTKVCPDCGQLFIVPSVGRPPERCEEHRR